MTFRVEPKRLLTSVVGAGTQFGLSQSAGMTLVDAAFTPDGKSYAYSRFNALSQLYLVDGLH